MKDIQFDDQRLKVMARKAYYSEAGQAYSHLESVLKKSEFTDKERNQLLELVDKSMGSRPLSIASMKNEIFSIIGTKSQYPSSPTVSRADLLVIYDYIRSLKK